jgi:hypothetical protein
MTLTTLAIGGLIVAAFLVIISVSLINKFARGD